MPFYVTFHSRFIQFLYYHSNPMAILTIYHSNAGEFLTAADAKSRTKKHRQEKEKQGYKPGEYNQAEFFGANRINKLLAREGCVGIRVYYGKRWEDDQENPTAEGVGRLKSRLILVGVRADGSDIFEDTTGLKDGGDSSALGNGMPCPQHCAP